jgi:hypothetical protein
MLIPVNIIMSSLLLDHCEMRILKQLPSVVHYLHYVETQLNLNRSL